MDVHTALAARARAEADRASGATRDRLHNRLVQASRDLAAWADAYAEALVEQASGLALADNATRLAATAPLTSAEAAAALNCTDRHVLNLCERGALRRVPGVGRVVLVVREDVVRLQRGEAPLGAGAPAPAAGAVDGVHG